MLRKSVVVCFGLLNYNLVASFGGSGAFSNSISCYNAARRTRAHEESTSSTISTASSTALTTDDIFQNFASFLQFKQSEIINTLEEADGSKFSLDKWGFFLASTSNDTNSSSSYNNATRSGGITRVIQGGNIIEKGAVSLTIIEQSVLSIERAKAIRSRSGEDVREGDVYSAAALSIVLHTRSPLVPTFRSDVRIFLVRKGEYISEDNDNALPEFNSTQRKQPKLKRGDVAWFGGGADLTPYYIFEEDIRSFHRTLRSVCDHHFKNNGKTYKEMKQMCDEYFYLPARKEHRGTGGIFYDDLIATENSLHFTKDVVKSWMPSWLDTIVLKRNLLPYTEKQRQWQLLRRGRYLEFNLLYDRGVRFGLASENPRVEGVMVSAPPLVAFAYNHEVEVDSDEEKLMLVLKAPRDWL